MRELGILYGYSTRIIANESYEKRRGPRQCIEPTQTTKLFLPFHFSIHLNQIQPDDRRRTFVRNVKLIYFPTQYNDADDYHSSNGQRDSARACSLQMVLVMERQYVYFAAEATFLCVIELHVMVGGNNVDNCTVFKAKQDRRESYQSRQPVTLSEFVLVLVEHISARTALPPH